MFDSYDVPEGSCAFEKGTGYWRYESEKGLPREGVKREAFISDEELMKMTEKFIEARGVFEEGQYTMTIAESLQGNGDAGELVLSKEVSVCPLIDGCQVWGVYRLIFSFDSRGEIAEISSYFNPLKFPPLTAVPRYPQNTVPASTAFPPPLPLLKERIFLSGKIRR